MSSNSPRMHLKFYSKSTERLVLGTTLTLGENMEGSFDKRNLDKYLDREALSSLPSLNLDELKELKNNIEEVEAEISYQRRLLQGRLDILKALKSGDLDSEKLMEMLPSILADKDDADAKRGKVEKMWLKNYPSRRHTDVLIDELTPLTSVSVPEEKLHDLLNEAEGEEKRLSHARNGLHKLLDAIRRELGFRIVPSNN